MMELNGQTVTVIGAAKSGLAAARLLFEKGARVRVSDQGPLDKFPADFLSWAKGSGVGIEYGGHTRDFIETSALVVVSPGVRFDAPPLVWARERGIPVWGEIELGFRLCPKPVIAVTGSNGKTTVVTLITKVLQEAGYRALLCGNVGVPFCACVADFASTDFVVLEVSSFQMETIVTFRPAVAVLLNFSQNHLDRHKDIEEYFTAKTGIFKNQSAQDYAVLNFADPRVRALASRMGGQVVFFNQPQAQAAGSVINPNFLAVMTVARILDIGEDVCWRVFDAFPGVEHRMERVRVLDGVEFINDSKSTTAEAGRWAIANVDKPIILLCGGRDKNIDFSVLQELVQRKVKKLIAFGEARGKMERTFGSLVPVELAGTLPEAVAAARRCAQNGDCILLSPMCASFDMFRNYEDRGKVFKQIVQELS